MVQPPDTTPPTLACRQFCKVVGTPLFVNITHSCILGAIHPIQYKTNTVLATIKVNDKASPFLILQCILIKFRPSDGLGGMAANRRVVMFLQNADST